MASIDDLVAALAGQDTQAAIAAENPYFQFKSAPDLIGQAVPKMLAQDPGKYSTKQALALALGSGLLSGTLQSFGNDYQNTLTDRFNKTALDVATGKPRGSEYLPANLFRRANDAVSIFQTKKALEQQKSKEDLQLAIDNKITELNDPELQAAEKKAKIDDLMTQFDPAIVNAQIAREARLEGIRGSSGADRRQLPPGVKQGWVNSLGLSPEESASLNTATDIDRILAARRMQGERMRPISEKETNLLTSKNTFKAEVLELKNLANNMDENAVKRALKAAQIPALGAVQYLTADTETPEYQLYAKLGALVQKAAKAELGSQISDFDVRSWVPLLKGMPAIDKKQTVIKRLDSIIKDIDRGKLITFKELGKGSVNLQNYSEDINALESQFPNLQESLLGAGQTENANEWLYTSDGKAMYNPKTKQVKPIK